MLLGEAGHVSAHRRPPPFKFHGKGTCSLCAKPILKADGSPDTRKSWHPGCVWDWKVATSSGAARDALLSRDGGRCRDCGICSYRAEPGSTLDPEDVGRIYVAGVVLEYPMSTVRWKEIRPWAGDHDVPLWSVDREAPGAFRFWTLANLVTRCDECHKAKSALEAAQRAKEKRIRARLSGEVKRKRKIPSRPFSTQHRPLRRMG